MGGTKKNTPLQGVHRHRWELYCQARAAGSNRQESAKTAGFTSRRVCETEKTYPEISARIEAIQRKVENKVVAELVRTAVINRSWLTKNVLRAVESAGREVPVLTPGGTQKKDSEGNPLTKLFDMAGFLKGLELGGRTFGAFSDRVIMNDGEKLISNMSLAEVREFVKKQQDAFAGIDGTGAEGAEAEDNGEEAASPLRVGGKPDSLH